MRVYFDRALIRTHCHARHIISTSVSDHSIGIKVMRPEVNFPEFSVNPSTLGAETISEIESGRAGIYFGLGFHLALRPGHPTVEAIGTIVNSRTTASQKCEVVPRRARIQGSYTFESLNSRPESDKEERRRRRRKHGESDKFTYKASNKVSSIYWELSNGVQKKRQKGEDLFLVGKHRNVRAFIPFLPVSILRKPLMENQPLSKHQNVRVLIPFHPVSILRKPLMENKPLSKHQNVRVFIPFLAGSILRNPLKKKNVIKAPKRARVHTLSRRFHPPKAPDGK